MALIKKVKDDFIVVKVPREFLEVVDMRVISEDMPSRSEFLRILGKRIRPTVNDLRRKGLINNDDGGDDKFDFIPPQ